MSTIIKFQKTVEAQVLDFFHVKQLADHEAALRRVSLQALRAYKTARKLWQNQTDREERSFCEAEQQILKRHACDRVQAYWRVRRNFRKAFRLYLDENIKTKSRLFLNAPF